MTTIVTFGMGGWYPQGTARLKRSCDEFGYNCQVFNYYPEGCKSHAIEPYAFKPACLDVVRQGYDRVIWCDASGWLAKDPKPIFDIIDRDGYFILNGGWSNAQWCTDRQLQAFGFIRDEAESQNHCVGGLFGINFATKVGMRIFEELKANTHLFTGHWNNCNRTESQDERCLGSRHDQSVLSLIAAKHKLKIHDCTGLMSLDPNATDAIFLMQGM